MLVDGVVLGAEQLRLHDRTARRELAFDLPQPGQELVVAILPPRSAGADEHQSRIVQPDVFSLFQELRVVA